MQYTHPRRRWVALVALALALAVPAAVAAAHGRGSSNPSSATLDKKVSVGIDSDARRWNLGGFSGLSLQAELKACAVRVEPVAARRAVPSVGGRRRRLVVGAGMAGRATVEAALAQDAGAFDVAIVGREPELPYNRVLLSRLLAGAIGEPDVGLRPAPWYADQGVRVVTGTAVERLDLAARRALLGDGSVHEYDQLVLATGSLATLPPIAGLAGAGAIAFRSLADVRTMLAATRAGRRAVVIGGGLLGVAAYPPRRFTGTSHATHTRSDGASHQRHAKFAFR